jgi:hypothetical protein
MNSGAEVNMKKYIIIFVAAATLLAFTPLSAFSQTAGPDISKHDFEFDSGGEYHVQGHGAWHFRLSDQSIAMTHRRNGKILLNKTYSLSKAEKNKLWELIYSLNLPALGSSTRKGQPDEVMYTFVYTAKEKRKISIWIDDAAERKGMSKFITYLKDLVQKKTGKKAVLC